MQFIRLVIYFFAFITTKNNDYNRNNTSKNNKKTLLPIKQLLVVTALIEAALGLALIAVPSFVILLLFGISPDGVEAAIVARGAGAAIFSLAIACWFSRNLSNATAVVKAMLFYNVAVGFVLLFNIYPTGLSGVFCGLRHYFIFFLLFGV